MPQGKLTGVGPNQITFPFRQDNQNIFTINSISIDNGTNVPITINDLGGTPIYNVPKYQSRSIATEALEGFTLTNPTGAVVQATDTLNVYWYDKVLIPSFSAYGPAAWGAGVLPATLQDVNPGDPFLNTQIEQIIKYLQNAGVTGQLTINGQIVSTGTVAGLNFSDRDGVGGDLMTWYLLNGIGRLNTSIGPLDILTIDETGNTNIHGTFTSPGRITSGATGASAKPLLNPVPVADTQTVINPPILAASTSVIVNGLPASAVMANVAFLLTWTGGPATATAQLIDTSGAIVAQVTGTTGIVLNGLTNVVAASRQITYNVSPNTITGAILTVTLNEYKEPS